jgi:hypothetical protein
MLQRDFVLRLIDQLGVIARAVITGQQSTEEIATARAALEQASQQGLGLPLDTISQMSPTALVQLFRDGGGAFSSRVALAGHIFSCESKIARAAGDSHGAVSSAQKALYCFDQVRSNSAAESDYSIDEQRAALVEFLRERDNRGAW